MSNQNPQQPGWAQRPAQPGWTQPQQQWGAPQQPGWGAPPPPKKSPVGKILGFGCLGIIGLTVVIAVIISVASSGGSGSSVTSTPASATARAGHSAGAKSGANARKPDVAKIGDTISLKGTDDGSKLDVTVVKVVDPAKPADEFTQAGAGKRFVGVQFQLVNTGTAAYSDSPSNGAQVADRQGQQFESTFGDISAGPSMSSDVRLKPGAKALGWIVFEVPKASKVTTVHFAMDSGFADQTGEWKLS
ncbi:DUF4352 domain-containing protein [Streptomyces sp. NPDC001351]|uniref:DUF4352 domain-containing protein n=1 Tax=Streptomyces sp. NPDC001351 TaxID=3364564 RepID=UPI0036C2E99D